jgi:hypothetical protein
MDTDKLEKRIDALKKSVDTLILIEVAKSGATREHARKVLGGLTNTEFSKVAALFTKPKVKK